MLEEEIDMPPSGGQNEIVATTEEPLPKPPEWDISRVLKQWGDTLSHSPDETPLLQSLLAAIKTVIGADMLLLFGWDIPSRSWGLLSSIGMPDNFGVKVSKAWHSLPSLVVQGGPIFSNDLSHDPRFIGQIIRMMNVQSFAGIPLQSVEEPQGVLCLGFWKPDVWVSSNEEAILTLSRLVTSLIPQQVATPLPPPALPLEIPPQQSAPPPPFLLPERKKKWDREYIRAEIYSVLLTGLGHSFDLQKVLGDILNKIVYLLEADGGSILQWNHARSKLFLVSEIGMLREHRERLHKQGIGAHDGMTGKIIEKKYLLETQAGHQQTKWFKMEGIVSLIGGVIEQSDRLWGTLSLFSRNRNYTQSELDELVATIGTIERAIAVMTQVQPVHESEEAPRLTQEMLDGMSKSVHLDQLFASVVSGFAKMVSAENAYLFVFDPDRNLLTGVVATGNHSRAIRKMEFRPDEHALVSITFRERRPIMIEDLSEDGRIGRRWLSLFKSRSILSVPFMTKGKALGVVLMDETRRTRLFTPEETDKVMTMAGQVAVAIENGFLQQGINKQIEHARSLTAIMVDIREAERQRVGKLIHPIRQSLDEIKRDMTFPQDPLQPLQITPMTEVVQKIDQVSEALRETASERHLMTIEGGGIIPTLRKLAETCRRENGISVQFNVNGELRRFPVETERLLYQTTKEALANIAKHAKARTVLMTLEKRGRGLFLAIVDDGKGFDIAPSLTPDTNRDKFGLLAMKERVLLAGGSFSIDSGPESGTRISVLLPAVGGRRWENERRR